jgi:hypothetical protein
MPHRTTSRLRELLDELQKAQSESGGLVRQARQDIAGVIANDALRPIGTSGSGARKKKAAKKKR